MVEEIWKVIEGSDGHYFISNLGHMKRDDYICYDAKGRKLKRKAKYWTTGNFNKKNGYYSYAFRGADGTRQKNYVHRLVAEKFCKKNTVKFPKSWTYHTLLKHQQILENIILLHIQMENKKYIPN